MAKKLERNSEMTSPAPVEMNICGQAGLERPEASNLLRGVDSFLGGLSRRDPVGGSAKGMPLKDSILVTMEPMTVPEGMATVTFSARS